jgi:multidrug efflux pump subunit AcrB
MNLTDLSTRHWPSVAAAVALVALFGLTSIASLPIQLLPNIEEPQVSISNFWRGAENLREGIEVRIMMSSSGATTSTASEGA